MSETFVKINSDTLKIVTESEQGGIPLIREEIITRLQINDEKSGIQLSLDRFNMMLAVLDA